MLATLALVFARLRRGKSVYWVQDLFPDIAVRLGVIKNRGMVHRLCAALARTLHARCDLLVALGPAMARALIERGASAERIRVIHNWADAEAITPLARDENPFVYTHGLEHRFVVQYSGNAGRAHTFDAVCESMRMLRDESDIVFQFIGGGRQMPAVKAAVSQAGLTNVRFLDYLERDRLCFSLCAANVALVTEHERVTGLLVPSKTYGIMASGRPIIFVGSHTSDVAAIVREAGCGRIVAPNDALGLALAILFFRDHPAEAETLGARGRLAAETTYNRRESTGVWSRALDALVSAPVFPNMSLHTGETLVRS
jgi:glycosyltransferase involved in cell wall biosynthesis